MRRARPDMNVSGRRDGRECDDLGRLWPSLYISRWSSGPTQFYQGEPDDCFSDSGARSGKPRTNEHGLEKAWCLAEELPLLLRGAIDGEYPRGGGREAFQTFHQQAGRGWRYRHQTMMRIKLMCAVSRRCWQRMTLKRVTATATRRTTSWPRT